MKPDDNRRTHPHSFSLDDEVFARLKQYSREQRLSMSSILTRFIMSLDVQDDPLLWDEKRKREAGFHE